MSELLQILGIAIALYAMKALPFFWRFVPRTALADQIFDLLPVALLMAMLMPQVLTPLFVLPPPAGDAAAFLAVLASFAICLFTNRSALAIGTGFAILALAEFL